jgi:hypothetical protein
MAINHDPWFLVHGLDSVCIVFGFINWLVQKFRKRFRWLDQRSMIFEFGNGAAMPPVFLLMVGSLATPLIIYLSEHGNAVLICLSGLAALLALADASYGGLQTSTEPKPSTHR